MVEEGVNIEMPVASMGSNSDGNNMPASSNGSMGASPPNKDKVRKSKTYKRGKSKKIL